MTLPKHYTLNSLLDEQYFKKPIPHYMTIYHLRTKQCLKIKNPIVDINNHLNKAFDSLNKELSSGFHLVDNFSDWFSFYSVKWKDTNAKFIYQNKLNNIHKNSSVNQNTILIMSDISIKNITILVSYIWRSYEIVAKTVYHAINISSTEAELFAIRCCISQAT